MQNVEQIISSATQRLIGFSESPRLDVEILLAHVLGMSRISLWARPEAIPTPDQVELFEQYLSRRVSGQSIAYLVGHRDFFGYSIIVSPAVLVPRPETELLIEKALEVIGSQTVDFLDLGTGSGCIAIALGLELKKKNQLGRCVACDESILALEVAKANARKHNFRELQFLESNWFSALNPGQDQFDLILANPPYLIKGDPQRSRETNFEPAEALFSSDNGLGDLKHLLSDVHLFLKPGGVFIFEIGARQGAELLRFVGEVESLRSFDIQILPDLAGHDRMIFGRR